MRMSPCFVRKFFITPTYPLAKLIDPTSCLLRDDESSSSSTLSKSTTSKITGLSATLFLLCCTASRKAVNRPKDVRHKTLTLHRTVWHKTPLSADVRLTTYFLPLRANIFVFFFCTPMIPILSTWRAVNSLLSYSDVSRSKNFRRLLC